jgi:hypothetical protein
VLSDRHDLNSNRVVDGTLRDGVSESR